MTLSYDEEIIQIWESKERALKKLEELSKAEQAKLEFRVDGSVWKDGKPLAVEPDYFEKAWFVRRMRGPQKARSIGINNG